MGMRMKMEDEEGKSEHTFATTNDESLTRTTITASYNKVPLFLTLKPHPWLTSLEINSPYLLVTKILVAEINKHLHTIFTQIETRHLIRQIEFSQLLATCNVEDVHGFVNTNSHETRGPCGRIHVTVAVGTVGDRR